MRKTWMAFLLGCGICLLLPSAANAGYCPADCESSIRANGRAKQVDRNAKVDARLPRKALCVLVASVDLTPAPSRGISSSPFGAPLCSALRGIPPLHACTHYVRSVERGKGLRPMGRGFELSQRGYALAKASIFSRLASAA